MAFDPQTHKISFLIGDIVNGKLKRTEPLPDLTCEESEKLREHLLYEISCLREHGEEEGGRKERRLLARFQETLDNDERRLGKGKGKAREEDEPEPAGAMNGRIKPNESFSANSFVFEDISGVKLVLRLANITNETLVNLTGYLAGQLIDRHLELPHGFPIQSPPVTPDTDSADQFPEMAEPQLNREWSTTAERQDQHQGRPLTPQNTFDIIDLVTPPETPTKSDPAKPVQAEVPIAPDSVEGSNYQIAPSFASSLPYLLAGIILGFILQNWLLSYDLSLGILEGLRSGRLRLAYLGTLFGKGGRGFIKGYLASLWDAFVNKAFLMMHEFGFIE